MTLTLREKAEKAFILDYFLNKYPTGIASYVSDTYDFFAVISKIVPTIKDQLLSRQPDALGFAKAVFRPDSGDPVKIICGEAPYLRDFLSVSDLYQKGWRYYREETCGMEEDKFYSVTQVLGSHGISYAVTPVDSTPEMLGAVEVLWNTFGGTVTNAGYRLLDSHVGLIYGDSITLDRAKRILEGLANKGFASGNIVFGIGSYTYQGTTRDTFGCAIKATAVVVNGELIEIYKDPKTDDGAKKSARGLLRVEKENGEYVLYQSQTPWEENLGLLRPVLRDGEDLNHTTFGAIRNRIMSE